MLFFFLGVAHSNPYSSPVKMKNLSRALVGALLLSFLSVIDTHSAFAATYSFTNAGATGAMGPTQLQVTNAYSGTSLAGQVTINTQGIQEWVVPATGDYTFEVVGAHGAASTGATNTRGGRGVKITATKTLTQGMILYIGVGQAGSASGLNGGGGGASFVAVDSRTTTLNLLVAGGGGGTRQATAIDGGDASTSNAGMTASSVNVGTGAANLDNTTSQGATGGYAVLGYGGRMSSTWGDSGAGWLGAGVDDGSGGGAVSAKLSAAATGGTGTDQGGFGGGGAGAGANGGGGGGGYTGGNGGWVAGGGGSYDAGFTSVVKAVDTARTFARGGTAVHGYVTITRTAIPSTTTITIADTTFTYRAISNISATSSGVGKISFKANQKWISGCRNLAATAGNSYTATCPYRPTVHGTVVISAFYTSTDGSYLNSSISTRTFPIVARSGRR
ncbi:MAG: hypothetical protein RLZZ311_889 [Actinomycetota bacterium]|jgi:hypothetical protein